MTEHDDNPFVRFGLDPSSSLAELTERLRELAEDADEKQRAALRAAWESLTRSPARRLELVLEAGPSPEPLAAARTDSPVMPWPSPTLADLLAPAPLAPQLPPPTAAERALLRVDLGPLVREEEASLVGELGRRTR
jgi:hypothetical protein